MSTELALRPMSTSQILDRTFQLYRRNFVLFAGIAALPPALVLLGQLLLFFTTSSLGRMAGSSPTTAMAGVAAAGLGFLVLLVLALLGYAFASGASVYAVSRLHLGHPTTIAESYRLILPYFGSILGIVVIVGVVVFLVIGLGAACLIVPIVMAMGGFRAGLSSGSSSMWGLGIFIGALIFVASLFFGLVLSAKFSFAVPACVLERRGVIDSISRSWNLTQGSVWRLILVIILVAFMAWLLSLVLSIPYFVGIAIFISKKNPSVLIPFVIWQYVAGFLARTMAAPVSAIATALMYYDQRIRKEAFDLQLMMEAIGQPSPQQAAGASAPGIG
jgi:hypothetical protein